MRYLFEEITSDSLLICLLPSNDVLEQLSSICEEKLPHVTIAYIPSGVNDSTRRHIIELVQSIAVKHCKMFANFNGMGRFKNQATGEQVKLMLVNAPNLDLLSADIMNALIQQGFVDKSAREYGFIPHLTLGYRDVQSKFDLGERLEDRLDGWLVDKVFFVQKDFVVADVELNNG